MAHLDYEEDFKNILLDKDLISKDLVGEYVKWVKEYHTFLNEKSDEESTISTYKKYLMGVSDVEIWQVEQAIEAVSLYYNTLPQVATVPAISNWREAMEAVHNDPNFNMYSSVTQKTYITWLNKVKDFYMATVPSELTVADLQEFIQYTNDNSSLNVASRNHVIAALLYFMRCILKKDSTDLLGMIEHVAQSKRPVVIEDQHIEKIYENLTDHYYYISLIMSECGLRLDEAVSLRVRDVDLEQNYIVVRSNKSITDRYVFLSDRAKMIMNSYLLELKEEYNAMPNQRRIEVVMPIDLINSDEFEPISWELQWLFPAKSLIVDECDGKVKRNHIHKSSVQRSIKLAVKELGFEKSITPHTFRHCFAVRMLKKGYDLEVVQKMLGQNNINSTLVYTLFYP